MSFIGSKIPIPGMTGLFLQPTLGDLFAQAGTSAQAVAAQIGVDPVFLARVVARRQPLPIDVAARIAAALGSDVGTIQAAAGLITSKTGPIQRVAVPPDPLLGDVIASQPLGRTQPIVAQSRSSVAAWVTGQLLSGDGVHDGVAIVDRALGVIGRIVFPNLAGPKELAFGAGGDVYASGGNQFTAQMTVAPAASLALEVPDAHVAGANGLAYESSTNTLWVCANQLVRVGKLSPLDSTAFALTVPDAGHVPRSAAPKNAVCFGGAVYVAAYAGVNPGGVLKIDPSTGNVLQTWTDPAMVGAVQGLAWDGAKTLVVGNGTTLWSIDVTSAAPPQALTTTSGSLALCLWITFINGSFWVSDFSVAHPHYLVFKPRGPSAVVSADLTVASAAGSAGHVAADVDGFIWATIPSAGQVRIFDPSIVSGDPTAQSYTVGGTPDGILLL